MAAPKLFDRVKETTTTTGTGTVTLAGAVAGYRSFTSVLADGDLVYYAIVLAAEWEVGIGTFTTSGTTLARTTILASSNAGAAVSFSAGDKDVFITLPASIALSSVKTVMTAHVGYTATIAQNTTVYMGPSGHEATGDEAVAQHVMPVACTFDAMYCKVSANVGGSGQTVIFTVFKNGVATSMAVTINTGASTGNTTANPVTFAAGDTWSVRVVNSATTGSMKGHTAGFLARI